ncbi:CPBP family intramembrane metalloprotease [Aliikangiella marina]|uniref:CPBP family intramembrane metalloprotease n=1 Tax=Aliikangiella marina TaxID=1712262 RepID=A0A545TJE2_9GAMM|nr:CPBP family intramembrane glutamic endopeptidase [Aliikangiella marina]TQV77354.1 CPBP family intramembrane metalloprotease [Aliikangiella marina]
MNLLKAKPNRTVNFNSDSPSRFLFDILIYIAVMFSIREIYFAELHFLANGLFWSTITLVVATWRMKVRGVTWKDLGLCRPKNYKMAALATILIPIASIAFIIAFKAFQGLLGLEVQEDNSNEAAVSKFGDLYGNWLLFFTIIPFVWIQSALEEMLDRGFLIVWFEKIFSSTVFATILAVLFQAIIFGYRHSNDFSERSITVGLIGLAMGLGYVLFGRNLWPLIIAHCFLNTVSMVGRVV